MAIDQLRIQPAEIVDDGTDLIYNSGLSEGVQPVEQVEFLLDTPSLYKVEQPVVTSAPVYQPASDVMPIPPSQQQTMVTPQTLLVQKVEIVPDLSLNVVPDNVVKVDFDKLKATYPGSEAIRVLRMIESNEPLPAHIAEQLVTSGIISEPTIAETVPTVPQVSLPSVPVNEPQTTQPVIKNKKKGLLDKITDYVYGFLYNKK